MTIDPGQQYQLCPICGMAIQGVYTGRHHLECIRCGRFSIGDIASMSLENNPLSPRQRANISGYLFENPGFEIVDRNLEFLRQLRTPSVAERATKLLACLAKQQPILGESINIAEWSMIDKLLPAVARRQITTMPGSLAQRLQPFTKLLGATSTINGRELTFLLMAYLREETEFVEVIKIADRTEVTITAKGWQHLETLPTGASDVGFVAMWFAEEMTRVWEEGFYPGIHAAGYVPVRIDKKEHNNKIDDEILASIRAAKFVVADFTGQRGGVYYEAGFASGLSKPVIWTVRKEDLHQVHFDTRQFNHIAWEMSALPNFKTALQKRIEATFGRGPVLPS